MSLLAHHQLLMATIEAPVLTPILWSTTDREGAMVVTESGRTLTINSSGGAAHSIRSDVAFPVSEKRYFEIDVVTLVNAERANLYFGFAPGWTAISAPASDTPWGVNDFLANEFSSAGGTGGNTEVIVQGDRLRFAVRIDSGKFRMYFGIVGHSPDWTLLQDPTIAPSVPEAAFCNNENGSHPGELKFLQQYVGTTAGAAVLRLVPRAEFTGSIPSGYGA